MRENEEFESAFPADDDGGQFDNVHKREDDARDEKTDDDVEDTETRQR